MSITPEDVRKIAHLARLGVEEDQLADYAGELSRALELVDQLNQTDTSVVEPMANPGQCQARLRDDIVTEERDRQKLQAVAPQVENGFFLVPRVIE